MSETKKGICISVISLVLFNVLICLLEFVDVQEVGLYGLNHTYLKEYNKAVDIISDVLFYIVIAFGVFLVGFTIYKLIKREANYKFYAFFIVLAFVVLTFIIFEFCVTINTRPYPIDGKIESSFPSTHVFITTYIMLASPYMFLKMEGNKGLEKQNKLGFEEIVTIIMLVVILLMTILRLYSGMHWLTDCIGGLILGVFYYGVYYLIISIIKNKKSEKSLE